MLASWLNLCHVISVLKFEIFFCLEKFIWIRFMGEGLIDYTSERQIELFYLVERGKMVLRWMGLVFARPKKHAIS